MNKFRASMLLASVSGILAASAMPAMRGTVAAHHDSYARSRPRKASQAGPTDAKKAEIAAHNAAIDAKKALKRSRRAARLD